MILTRAATLYSPVFCSSCTGLVPKGDTSCAECGGSGAVIRPERWILVTINQHVVTTLKLTPDEAARLRDGLIEVLEEEGP